MDKKVYFEIGKNLKEVRKNKGLTQKQVFNLTGISIATIKDVENKKHIPKENTLNKLFKLFPELKSNILNSNFNVTIPNEVVLENLKNEIEIKKNELIKIEQAINIKNLEYNSLERNSGIRSKITWACIDIQKNNSSKITEIMSLFSLARNTTKEESVLAIEQLIKFLDNISYQLKKMIKFKEEIEI